MTPNPFDAITLSVEQSFERERLGRTIDETTSVQDLRKLCRLLLDAWHTQKAATAWLIRNPPPVRPAMPANEKA